MKITDRIRESLLKINVTIPYRRWLRIMGTSALTLVLTLNLFPDKTVFIPVHAPVAQTTSDLTFISEADAHVKQANPTNNYGSAASLLVDDASNADVETFLRFTVTGVSGTVQEARVRLYDTTNGTKNGPAIYATDPSWTETAITWNNRPDRTSAEVDNKARIATSSWVEYNVTSRVSGDGTFSFVLAADSGDGVRFSSREGRHPPELIVTLKGDGNTPVATDTSIPEATVTLSPAE